MQSFIQERHLSPPNPFDYLYTEEEINASNNNINDDNSSNNNNNNSLNNNNNLDFKLEVDDGECQKDSLTQQPVDESEIFISMFITGLERLKNVE